MDSMASIPPSSTSSSERVELIKQLRDVEAALAAHEAALAAVVDGSGTDDAATSRRTLQRKAALARGTRVRLLQKLERLEE